ncbi:pre-mRNA 3'-end-processing factor FIP1 isoform X5 [Oryzias melastigma]|uniref:pre-mRNA 3'-end-processing factor FIP1 isoform X5 n=1 Tax=Oryzias melastigma TaxID=30732 RepID=UPI00168D0104|nr:pre-mRNA 3'-end-processing factor FIP1 isoform X5 [Oryzias melastigma]
MSSSANSAEASEEDEEGKLYQYIYELKEDTGETERTPVCSSPKNSPVRLEIHVERRTLTAETPKMRRLKKAKGIKKSVQTREPSQKKPWNEPSANVSDYFNYGFTEDTWKAYCKKQTKLQGFKQSQKLQVMAQKTRTGVKAEESVSAENVSGKPAAVASSRKSEANGGVRNGPSGSRSRKKSSPCYRARGAQEVSDTSHEENSSPFYEKPHGDSTRRLFPLVSPPSFLFQPRSGYGSSFCTSTLSRVKEQTKAWSSKDEHHRGCRFKDLMGENRRTDRNRKPDSSSRRSCNRTNEEKTMAQDAKRRKKKMKSKKTSIALADQKGL